MTVKDFINKHHLSLGPVERVEENPNYQNEYEDLTHFRVGIRYGTFAMWHTYHSQGMGFNGLAPSLDRVMTALQFRAIDDPYSNETEELQRFLGNVYDEFIYEVEA